MKLGKLVKQILNSSLEEDEKEDIFDVLFESQETDIISIGNADNDIQISESTATVPKDLIPVTKLAREVGCSVTTIRNAFHNEDTVHGYYINNKQHVSRKEWEDYWNNRNSSNKTKSKTWTLYKGASSSDVSNAEIVLWNTVAETSRLLDIPKYMIYNLIDSKAIKAYIVADNGTPLYAVDIKEVMYALGRGTRHISDISVFDRWKKQIDIMNLYDLTSHELRDIAKPPNNKIASHRIGTALFVNEDEIKNYFEKDSLYEQAVLLTKKHDEVSISMLQVHFNIGYVRAKRLVDTMEKKGIIGSPVAGGKRRIVLSNRYN